MTSSDEPIVHQLGDEGDPVMFLHGMSVGNVTADAHELAPEALRPVLGMSVAASEQPYADAPVATMNYLGSFLLFAELELHLQVARELLPPEVQKKWTAFQHHRRPDVERSAIKARRMVDGEGTGR